MGKNFIKNTMLSKKIDKSGLLNSKSIIKKTVCLGNNINNVNNNNNNNNNKKSKYYKYSQKNYE
jgi:hypothetical protein